MQPLNAGAFVTPLGFFSFFLDCYLPFRLVGGMLGPIPATCEGEVHCWLNCQLIVGDCV